MTTVASHSPVSTRARPTSFMISNGCQPTVTTGLATASGTSSIFTVDRAAVCSRNCILPFVRSTSARTPASCWYISITSEALGLLAHVGHERTQLRLGRLLVAKLGGEVDILLRHVLALDRLVLHTQGELAHGGEHLRQP